jgi:hypothetical protein
VLRAEKGAQVAQRNLLGRPPCQRAEWREIRVPTLGARACLSRLSARTCVCADHGGVWSTMSRVLSADWDGSRSRMSSLFAETAEALSRRFAAPPDFFFTSRDLSLDRAESR